MRMREKQMRAHFWRGRGWLLVPILGVCAALAVCTALAAAEPPAGPSLQQILLGLDRTSYLYLDSALRFACKETVLEWNRGSRSLHKFEYLFVYDKSRGFQDYRMVVSKGQRQPANPIGLGVRLFLERPYMWVLVFNRTRQDKYRYQLLGTEKIGGVPTVQVRFEPIPPYKESINDWFGTAWIDPSTYQIVRVEAMKTEDFEEQSRLEKDREEIALPPAEGPGRSYRIEQVSTDFTVIKNGMRFPGKAKVVSTLYYLPKRPEGRNPEEISEEHSAQTYSKYRFYGVRTFEEVQKILSPDKKPAR